MKQGKMVEAVKLLCSLSSVLVIGSGGVGCSGGSLCMCARVRAGGQARVSACLLCFCSFLYYC